MKHIPPDLSWKDEAQLKLWQSQMDEWYKQNPKTFMQDSAVGFGFLIFGGGVLVSVTLAWNGFNISPVPEIIAAVFGYFGCQETESQSRGWERRRETFAKKAQDFIRTNKVTSIKVKLLEFSEE